MRIWPGWKGWRMGCPPSAVRRPPIRRRGRSRSSQGGSNRLNGLRPSVPPKPSAFASDGGEEAHMDFAVHREPRTLGTLRAEFGLGIGSFAMQELDAAILGATVLGLVRVAGLGLAATLYRQT